MQIHSAVFIQSAASPRQFLRRPVPHIVFAGKSNVGKSSLLNKVLHRKNLAKTSQTPGKTRLINYFLINDRCFFVDIPGYGYAKVGMVERRGWAHLIETYLKETPLIELIFQLLDIRHNPKELDLQMITWLRHYQLPFRILLTKADKLSKNKIRGRRREMAEVLGMKPEWLIPTSAVTALGIPEVRSLIEHAVKAGFQSTVEDGT